MLTAAELTAMQATQTLTMTETCVVSARTLTSDSAGGYTESWATTTTVGRLAPVSGAEAVVAGQQRAVATWKITLTAGVAVTPQGRIAIGSRSFEVLEVRGAETRETARVCLCQER